MPQNKVFKWPLAIAGNLLVLVCCFAAARHAHADDDDVLAPTSFADARANVLEWVAQQNVKDQTARDAIAELWAEPESKLKPAQILDRAIRSFSLADSETGRFVGKCDIHQPPAIPPNFKALTSAKDTSEFYKANLGAWYGYYLSQARYYDEALAVLKTVNAKQTIDPASCLFYTAVCQHQLLKRDAGLKTIKQLTSNTESVPIRYSSVAELMKYDLEQVEKKTIGEVAHLMSDVERRLDLGRGGQRVQKREAEIVATLDEIIERLENQNGGGGGGGQGGNQNQPQNGAQDSSVKGSPGDGKVDKKKQGEGKWGMLDDKDEARAKQLIGRDFPPHYRRAVEEYFRKLAKQRATRGR